MDDRDRYRNDDRNDDKAPNSRIFIVCNKSINEKVLKEAFSKFGKIEHAHFPQDRNTGESKGVAFVKYAKTSSAAAAIKELNKSTLPGETKPLKVMIASNRNESGSDISENKFKRLFIKVPKSETEDDVKQHFSKFGKSASVFILRNKENQESKGFAFINFDSFLETAIAFEECDRKYKPMFAKPKEELKRNRHEGEMHRINEGYEPNFPPRVVPQHSMGLISNGYNSVSVTVNPTLPAKFIQRLFNIIPGMDNFQYNIDNYNNVCRGIVSYQDHESAVIAVEKLNNYEFPSGEIISVHPNINPIDKAATDLKSMVETFKNSMGHGNMSADLIHLADAIAQASNIIKVATTNKVDNNMDEKRLKVDY